MKANQAAEGSARSHSLAANAHRDRWGTQRNVRVRGQDLSGLA